MGDNLCRNFPFPAPSLHPQACVPELTQTNLDFSDSGVTIESFRDPTPIAQLGQTMVWTNEKHNTYLDSLEASFVKQLHYSKSLHGCHPQVGMREPCLFPQQPAGHNSSHQFSILQDGCGQKINYESNDPLLESTADSDAVLGSPWLHHFRSNTNFYCKSAVNSKHNPIVNSCNHSLDSCTAEVSDQNFVAKDHGEKISYASGAKRMKMMTVRDASSDSQVAPVGNLHTIDDSIISNISAKRGKKKLLSDHPESLTSPKSDTHCFLRES
ncbi:hypothetical protein ERO13_A12G023800v2 [Gossypium hirsutum]|nr:hypothetical protein ERO13_A12G023800v2 [Gossypium hirsutum]